MTSFLQCLPKLIDNCEGNTDEEHFMLNANSIGENHRNEESHMTRMHENFDGAFPDSASREVLSTTTFHHPKLLATPET